MQAIVGRTSLFSIACDTGRSQVVVDLLTLRQLGRFRLTPPTAGDHPWIPHAARHLGRGGPHNLGLATNHHHRAVLCSPLPTRSKAALAPCLTLWRTLHPRRPALDDHHDSCDCDANVARFRSVTTAIATRPHTDQIRDGSSALRLSPGSVSAIHACSTSPLRLRPHRRVSGFLWPSSIATPPSTEHNPCSPSTSSSNTPASSPSVILLRSFRGPLGGEPKWQ